MTTLESALAGIEQMTSRATDGPWMWDDEVPTEFVSDYYKENAPWLVRDAGMNESIVKGEIAVPNQADAAFIAASRTLIPALVKALRTAVELSAEIANEENSIGRGLKFMQIETKLAEILNEKGEG